MNATKKTTKKAQRVPPPPPAPVPPVPEGCAVEKLNSRLQALAQARDVLIGIENLEDMGGERHGTQTEARERVLGRVREIARGIATDWTAHE